MAKALQRALGLQRFHVLAHDYGDTVAQELLARENAAAPAARRWRSVCFLNGGLFPETHQARLSKKLDAWLKQVRKDATTLTPRHGSVRKNIEEVKKEN